MNELSQKSSLHKRLECGTSHYHITLAQASVETLQDAARLIGGKPTKIDLIDDNILHDRMVTKHQSGNSLIPMLIDVKTLLSAGHKIARYKLEADVEDFSFGELSILPLNAANYIEIHFRSLSSIPILNLEGVKTSTNPDKIGHFFYNMRIKSEDGIELAEANLSKLANHMELHGQKLDVHREYTIFDSNTAHDAWWL